MSTPIALADGQHQLGTVLIGYGTPVPVAAIEGLGQPPVRSQDVEPPSEDGLWLGRDYYSGRLLRIDAGIKTPGDQTTALNVLAQLQADAADPALRQQAGSTMNLRLKFPGRDTRVVRGRLRKLEPDLSNSIHGWIPLDVEFQAADHLYYADTEQSTSIPLSVLEGGGFTAPIVAPIVVEASGEDRPGTITVDGTAPAWPILTVNGPCANIRITHTATGRVLELKTTIPAGESVTIDTRPTWRTVTRSGGGTLTLTPASRIDAFTLPPGVSQVQWTATDPTNTASLDVRWTPAWTAL